MTSDLIRRLKAIESLLDSDYAYREASTVREAADRIASLEAALAEARGALKPFAKAEISREAKDWERIAGWRAADRITFADLRRAARALDRGEG